MVLTGPAPAEATATVVVPRYVITDPDRHRLMIRGMTSACEQILKESLGRPVGLGIQTIAVVYGIPTEVDGEPLVQFRPMPCPAATHARVTVRLEEEQ